jgi:hypothetical protein
MTDREPVTHQLKVWPRFWDALESGKKTFELRLNDRDFRVGDILHLEEWDASCGHTGRTIEREVTCYLDGFPWLTEGYCCLGIKPVGQAAAKWEREIRNRALEDAAIKAASLTITWGFAHGNQVTADAIRQMKEKV